MKETLARMVLGWVKNGQLNAAQGMSLYRQLLGAAEQPGVGPATNGSGSDAAAQQSVPSGVNAVGSAPATEPIAVVGMSGVFPDAPDLGQFWRNLVAGRDSVREIHRERWADPGIYDPDPGQPDKTYCKWGGILTGIDQFDPLFFSISPREAEVMDPQQRLFLMESWKALEDAGYGDQELDGLSCGVFVGYGGGDYEQLLRDSQVQPGAYTFQGNTGSILAARISYFLNLRGPSLAIDTACSSSLVAIHLACESLRHGACRMALAGGVMIGVTPKFHVLTSRGQMLSKDGRCKAFSAGANGFVPGEGVAVVVLKPLRDALAQRDHIYGVINGSGLNQDGKTNGITAPSATSQTALECEVYEAFGISPDGISYVEAHGTGTELGDPIEIQALNDAFRKYTQRRRYCAIGSVKTNIGHALTAAGVAGVIKVLLCLQHRQLVPSLHFDAPNPHIDFEDSPFFVQTEVAEWKSALGQPRQAVVSAFGFSGTNAHVAVREAPEIAPRPGTSPEAGGVVVLSAKTKASLAQKVRDLRDWLDGAGAGAALADICYTLGKGRSHFKHRLALVVRDEAHLKETLRNLDRGARAGDGVFSSEDPGAGRGVAGSAERSRVATGGRATVGAALLDLAERYVRGETVDWDRWLEGSAGGRISMPAYPFEMESYWIPSRPAPGVAAEVWNAAAPAGAESKVFRHTLQAGDWLVDQHRVNGAAILPGVAFLEWVLGRFRSVGEDVGATHEPVARAAGWGERPREPDSEDAISGGPIRGRTAGSSEPRPTLPTQCHGWGERPREPDCEDAGSGEQIRGRTEGLGRLRQGFGGQGRRSLGEGGSSGASPHRMSTPSVDQGDDPSRGIALHDVVWMRPVAVRDAVDLELEFKPVGAGYEVELRSRAGEETTVHARAAAGSATDSGAVEAPALDLAGIRSRCVHQESRAGDAFYDRFRRMGLEYGVGFRALRELWIGAGETLGVIEAVGEGLDFDGNPALTPLLDAALHGIVGLDDGSGPLAMPFSLRRWRLLRPLPHRAWSWVRKVGEGNYDVSMSDEEGRVCVAFEGLTLRALPNRGQGLHYLPRWEQRPRAAVRATDVRSPAPFGTRTLLCVCSAGAARARAGQLMEHLPGSTRRLILQLGETTREVGPGEWEVEAGASGAVDQALDGLGPFSTVLFLVGEGAETGPEEGLRAAEAGVLAALQVVQACVKRRGLEARARIVFLTESLFAMARQDVVNPWSAALAGFAAGFRAEYPEWNISVLDWAWPGAEMATPEEWRRAEAWRALVDEIEHGTVGLVGLRGGDRFERVLRPLEFQGAVGDRLKSRGVYLVVGGAGGLGYQFSLYLAQRYQARIALLGRRPEDEGLRERLRSLEAAGGQACYVQADVTDLAALRRAVVAVRTRFGPIQGIVHSALVLEDALIRNLTPAEMARVLGPKVAGTVNLDLALREEPLEFMVCFSSAQSFRANVGQSPYASASFFQDAYAAYLNAHRSYPVFCLNWGYWGSVGIVSGDEFKQRLAAQGFGSIEPREGVETVDRFLSSPLRQIVCARATPALLAEMGLDASESMSVSGRENGVDPVPWAAVPSTGGETSGIDGFQRDFAALVEAGVERLWGWMAGRLWPAGSPDRLTAEEIERRLEIRPTYRRLCGSLLEMMVRRGRLRRDGKGFMPGVGGGNVPPHPIPLLPPMEARGSSKSSLQTWDDTRAWVERFPTLGGYVALLENCLGAFPELLRGSRKPMEVMFPGGAVAGMTAIYRGNPLSNYCNQVVAEAVATAVEHRLRAGLSRPVRILEVGAGVGGTSAFVLDRLAGFGARVAYDYTDIAGSFVRHGQEQFGERFPFVRFQVLDAEADFAAQGVADQSVDVIVGANVFHATRAVAPLLKRLQAALRPGGVLIINEITALNDYATMTYGLTDGWWLFEDEQHRIPSSPLLTVKSWQDRLWEAGFRGLHVWSAPGVAALGLSQSVVAAQREAVIAVISRVAAPVVPQERPAAVGRVEPFSAPGHEAAIPWVVETLSRVLKIKPERIDLQTTFENYGVDSLVVLEINKQFERRFGPLPATLLFEHKTVEELARHFVAKFPDRFKRSSPGQTAENSVQTAEHAEYAEKQLSRTSLEGSGQPGLPPSPRGSVEHGVLTAENAECAEGLRGRTTFVGTAQPGSPSSPVGSVTACSACSAVPSETVAEGGSAPASVAEAPRARVEHERAEAASAVERVGDIAIIGLAGRYPQAETLAEFWDNLRSGRNCITEVPPERWDWRASFHPEPHTEGKSYSRWAGFIRDVDRFDPMFFNLSPREAERMDPQERLFLMTVWRLLEDAGYSRREVGGEGRAVGVFVGAMYATYGQLAARAWERGQWTGAFSALWSIANRVSYFFDFQGPSLTVDTACSSSLTAIHLACESIRRGECQWAVAGGVNLILDPAHLIGLSSMDMLSRGDRCSAFGAGADGFVDGEGVGAVLLKPLDLAVKDGDRIHGVIKGSMINTGGKTGGYTVPNPAAQTAVIREALRRAGVEPETLGYVEAHGTGTALGDPIEMASLAQALGQGEAGNWKCAVGSVKSNIGHLEAAAGMAALTKVLLQFAHGALVPSIHAEELNPKIDFSGTPLVVQRDFQPWPRRRGTIDGRIVLLPRRAGISSFGAGGANAHLIVEEYVPAVAMEAEAAGPEHGGERLMVLSARTAERLAVCARLLQEHLRGLTPEQAASEDYLTRLAFTLQVAREPMLHRLAWVVSSVEELTGKLALWLEPGSATPAGLFAGEATGAAMVRSLVTGEAGRAYLAVIERTKDWGRLAQLWCQGAEIGWRSFYGVPAPRRVSLPGYPFVLKRYWIPAVAGGGASGAGVGVRAMLKGELDAQGSLGEGLRFRFGLEAKQPWIAGHQVNGQVILPGVVVMEMAMASLARFQARDERPRLSINWLEPVVFAAEHREVFLRWIRKDSRFEFELESERGGSSVVHARGTAEFLPGQADEDRVDGVGLLERFPDSLSWTVLAGACREAGIDYGDFYHTFEEVRFGSEEAVAWLEIPAAFRSAANGFGLHPALLDGAVQLCGAHQLRVAGAGGGLSIPFVAEGVELLRALPQRVLARVQRTAPDTYAVALLDPAGTVCLRMRELAFRKTKAAASVPIYHPGWRMTHARGRWPAEGWGERPREPDCEDADSVDPASGRTDGLGRRSLGGGGSSGASPHRDSRPMGPMCIRQLDVEAAHELTFVIVRPSGRTRVRSWVERAVRGARIIEAVWGDSTGRRLDDVWELNVNEPGAWADRLREVGALVCLIWLEPSPAVPDRLPLEKGRADDVGRCFKLLKLLTDPSRGEVLRQVMLVTEAGLAVRPGEVANPEGAGCHGLIQVLANEYPSVAWASVDIDPAETSEDTVAGVAGPEFVRGLLAERDAGRALRDGSRYRPVLEPAAEVGPQKPVIRARGVYWIVGGTGAIGLALSLHLAKRYQARLILSSRHELNPAQEAKLSTVREAGGEVMCVRADVCDLDSMRRALGEVRARFGEVNGVFHSALVLKAARFGELTERDFEDVVRPKVRGAAVLAEVFGSEPLDFMAFFSSTQSFLGDAGQAAYAVASRWQDAWVNSIGRPGCFPVHLIHWGYWDPQLIVTEEVRKRAAEFASAGASGVEAHLKALGYGILSVAEGMAALERILGQPDGRPSAVFKAAPDVLKRMGGDPDLRGVALPAGADRGVTVAWPTMELGAEWGDSVARFDRAARALAAWGGYRVLRGLQKLGGFAQVGDWRRRARWFEDLRVQPAFERLFAALMSLLIRQGLLEETEAGIGLAEAAQGSETAESAALVAVDRDGEVPGFRAFRALVGVCGERYADLLAGKVSPNEVMFSDPSLVPAVYRGNPVAEACNQVLARGFESWAAAEGVAGPTDGPQQILEVGAGTGGTTQALRPWLQANPGRFRYTFTDLSSSLVQAAQREFGPLIPGMDFQTLDLEAEVVAQGFAEGQFDLIIAANCLHATRDLRSSLRQVKRLLKRGGVLLLNEATAAQDFLTLTFGLLEGWWLFRDEELRLPHAPLLSLETWAVLLREEGFEGTRVLGSVGLGGAEHAQVVLATRSDGVVRSAGVQPGTSGRTAVSGSVARALCAATPAAPAMRKRSAEVREPRVAEQGCIKLRVGGATARRPETADARDEWGTRPSPLRHGAFAAFDKQSAALAEAGTGLILDTREKRFGRLEQIVVESLARVLRTDPSELEPGLPFADYGVDSIVAVEIVARLNEVLGLDLRSTALFNYPNVADLTNHILDGHGELIAWARLVPVGTTEPASARAGETAPAGVTSVEAARGNDEVSADRPRQDEIASGHSTKGNSADQARVDIAVIGWSGQFPDAPDIRQLWKNLMAGRDSVRDIPRERWEVDQYYSPDPETPATTYCRTCGTLAEIDLFDAAFFNLSPMEAERMDPQQRLLLMEAWKALEDAGYSEAALSGRACAFFVGCQDGDYRDLVEQRSAPNAYSLLGNLNATLAARVSYYLNLKGPTVAIDTACSSSLTAIHLACDAIRSGQCEMALAGGVAVLTTPKFHVLASQAGMLSKTGQCRAFDASADGFAPGEAVAVVVLKPLSQALSDRDRIYGVIKGSGLNQDGKSNGLTAPNGPSQTALEAGVYRRLGIDPRGIQYVECHGTGTRLGDPIEINALTDAFAQFTAERHFCGVGSIKTNIGHALAAAGVAGFIKAMLCLREATLVPSVHFKQANEALRLGSSPFYVVDRLAPWSAPAHGPRRAAVSAFGLSGTNCHVVLEEAPSEPPPRPDAVATGGWYLIPLSAKTESSLAQKMEALRVWLEQNPGESMSDLSYSLLCRRSHFSYRVCWRVRDREKLGAALAGGLEKSLRGAGVVFHLGENLRPPPAARGEAGTALLERLTARAGAAVALDAESARHLAEFYIEGCPLTWERLFSSARLTRVPLPVYPFDRRRFWIEATEEVERRGPVKSQAQLPARAMVLVRKTWEPCPLAASESRPRFAEGRVLILAGRRTLSLASALGERIPGGRVVLLVEATGSAVGPISISTLDPWDVAKADPTIQRLLEEGPRLQGVIDLSDLAAAEAGTEFRVPLGKIRLLQAFIGSEPARPLAIVHFTRELISINGSVPRDLTGALTGGLVKMLGAEYQRVRAVTVDLGAEAGDVSRLADIVQAEGQGAERPGAGGARGGGAGGGGRGEVAYRSGVRFVPVLETLADEPAGEASAAWHNRLDPAKFYVVTGGTRGIGFEIARHLVAGGVRKLVLMGREPLPPREQWAALQAGTDRAVSQTVREKIARFLELESQGVDLRVYAGSLTDEEALRRFFESLETEWGMLGGVVHCAGLASDEHPSFVQKDPETMGRVAEPKVEAMAVLDRLLASKPLDFFILFSSVSSLSPRLGVGFSDYAMANDFLNYYAVQRACGRPGVFQSLQWPGWKDVGMGQVKSPAYLAMGLTAHSTEDGLALFDRALGHATCPCLMPAVVDPERFRLGALLDLRVERVGPEAGRREVPAAVGASGETLRALGALIAKELKMPVEQLGIDTHFERLGVDSILLAEFTRRIERWLDVRLDPSCFLEHANLRALAAFLEQAYPDQLRKAAGQAPGAEALSAKSAEPAEGEPSRPAALPVTRVAAEGVASGADGRVAVIGMACHFPDAPDLEAYWQGLAGGRSSIREVPLSRWDVARFYRPTFEPGKSISKWGAFLEDIEDFDPEYFRIAPRLAPHIDPAIRQFLEATVQCLRDAGYEDGALDGRRVGVFVGARMSRYSARIRQPMKDSVIGIAQNFIGTHVSHFFNFTGPNVLIDTACSSSLVSIHQACQCLRLGEAEMVLAGGVDILLDETMYLRLSEGQALSPDGRCHTFDGKANGFVPGEGCGVVLLKPLERAIQDGDRIYAVIEGSAVNNDGRTMGMTTPNPEAQQAVVREALRRSGTTADAVGYVEAHGTGTMIGDPIELKALNRVFRESTEARRFCGVGSVKTNLGHLLSAAGVASFIKVALALRHRQLPPTLNCEKPNGRFNFQDSPFFPVLTLQDWAPRHGVRRAGISSFGFGGTNAHLIVRELTAEEAARIPSPRSPLPPVVFRRRRYWVEAESAQDSGPVATAPSELAPIAVVRSNGNGTADHVEALAEGRPPLLELDLADEREENP